MDSKNNAVRYIVSATPSARARASTSLVGMVSSTARVRLSGVRVPLTRYTFFDDGRRNRPISRGGWATTGHRPRPVSAGAAARLKADSEADAKVSTASAEVVREAVGDQSMCRLGRIVVGLGTGVSPTAIGLRVDGLAGVLERTLLSGHAAAGCKQSPGRR